MNAMALVKVGFAYFKEILPTRVIIVSYLIFLGIFDIAASAYNTSSVRQVLLELIGSLLMTLFSVVIIQLLRNGNHSFNARDLRLGGQLLFAEFISVLLISLGFVLLIVPGVLALKNYMYIPEAVILEANYGPNALARSSRLSSINGWKTAFACIIIYLIHGACQSIAFYTVPAVLGQGVVGGFIYNYFSNLLGSGAGVLIVTTVYAGYVEASAALEKES
jgi:hypothetical protein